MTKLVAKTRTELGSNKPKNLRKENKIPAVLYGSGENKNIYLEYAQFNKDVPFYQNNILFDLDIDGKLTKVLVRDYQYNIVKSKIEHIDFLAVNENTKVIVNIPVKLTGVAEGIKEGGSLFTIKRTIKVRCKYTDIPTIIELPIDALKIGEYIRISHIKPIDNVEILEDKKLPLGFIVGKIKSEK